MHHKLAQANKVKVGIYFWKVFLEVPRESVLGSSNFQEVTMLLLVNITDVLKWPRVFMFRVKRPI